MARGLRGPGAPSSTLSRARGRASHPPLSKVRHTARLLSECRCFVLRPRPFAAVPASSRKFQAQPVLTFGVSRLATPARSSTAMAMLPLPCFADWIGRLQRFWLQPRFDARYLVTRITLLQLRTGQLRALLAPPQTASSAIIMSCRPPSCIRARSAPPRLTAEAEYHKQDCEIRQATGCFSGSAPTIPGGSTGWGEMRGAQMAAEVAPSG